jgi:hypothetical protein
VPYHERLVLAAATVALGLVPATILVFFVLLVSVGISTELPANLPALVRLVGSLGLFTLALAGYVSLWLTLRAVWGSRTAIGLCAGLVSATFGVFLLWDEGYFPLWTLTYLFGGPILIGSVHPLRYYRK